MKANKLWSIIMTLIIMLATSITLTSCDKDDDAKGGDNKGLNGTIWVNYDEADYGIYEYLELNNGMLKRCLAATYSGMNDVGKNKYSWVYEPSNGGWYIATMSTYSYTVLNSNTIMSFDGQLIEITGQRIFPVGESI